MIRHPLRQRVDHIVDRITGTTVDRIVGTIARPLYAFLRFLRYHRALWRRQAAGELVYLWSEKGPTAGQVVEVRYPAATDSQQAGQQQAGQQQAGQQQTGQQQTGQQQADIFCAQQTLAELRAVGLDHKGGTSWRVLGRGVDTATAEAGWFYAPGAAATSHDPAFLETAMLLLAAETVDAMALLPDPPGTLPQPVSAQDLINPPWRAYTLFRADAYTYDPATDRIQPRLGARLVKVVPPCEAPQESPFWGTHRRGPFLANRALPPRLAIKVRDAASLCRQLAPTPGPTTKPAVLVLAPFLARGGAEQTLFETLRALSSRFDFTFVTLAPHLAERGDRRNDFRQITPRLFSLGDQVHPAAMPGILHALLDASGAKILYNANGSTLFYDFAPQLKAARPGLLILDHLYDHRVGYIARYDRHLLDAVDLCVAENHRIRDVLTEERGWPAERVPVIWPCGRPSSAFPSGEQAAASRRDLRHELGFGDDDLVLLTAARMHPQKRPLDLVRLAQRLRDLGHVHFLMVGGGELEDTVDTAIAAASGARIRRLAFRTDIPQLLLAADVGCLVSDYEGLPVFLLECLQAGRPFLGTDVGDMGRVLQATGAGPVVAQPGDLVALEQAVRQLANPSRRAMFAQRARDAAPAFGVEACAERYARVFLGATNLPPYPYAEDAPR